MATCLKQLHSSGLFFDGLTADHVLIDRKFKIKLIDRAIVLGSELKKEGL